MGMRRVTAGLLAIVLSLFLWVPPPPLWGAPAPDAVLRALPPGTLSLPEPPASRPQPWCLPAAGEYASPLPPTSGLAEPAQQELPPLPALRCRAHPKHAPPLSVAS